MSRKDKATKITALEMLGDMTLGASGLLHELSQPITGIKSGFELLSRQVNPEVTELSEWHMLANQISRLEEMLNTFRRILSSEGIEPGLFSVSTIVERAIDLVRFRLKNHLEKFSFAIETDKKQAYGVAEGLLHAVSNLLLNAIDAVEKHIKRGRIAVRIINNPERPHLIQVRVSDEGAGIDPVLQPEIFEPNVTSKKGARGSGFGLYMARQIVSAMGGRVFVVGQADARRLDWATTEFAVELDTSESSAQEASQQQAPIHRPPRQQTSAAQTSAYQQSGQKQMEASRPEDPATITGRARALVVDDEVIIVTVLQTALEKEHMDVTTAINGDEAAALLETRQFDLLITDKNMPGMDGVELAKKARQRYPDIGIVIITGYASKQSAENLLRLGVDDYITKPFDVDKLLGKLRSILHWRKTITAARHARSQPKVATERRSDQVLVSIPDLVDRGMISLAIESIGLRPVSVDTIESFSETNNLAGAVLSKELCGATAKAKIMGFKTENPDFKFVVVVPETGLSNTIASILLGAAGQLVHPLRNQAQVNKDLASFFQTDASFQTDSFFQTDQGQTGQE